MTERALPKCSQHLGLPRQYQCRISLDSLFVLHNSGSAGTVLSVASNGQSCSGGKGGGVERLDYLKQFLAIDIPTFGVTSHVM